MALDPEVGPGYRRVLLWVHSATEVDPAFPVALLLTRRGSGILHVVMGLDSPGRYRPAPSGRVEPLTPAAIERVCTALADLYGAGRDTGPGDDWREGVEVHTMVLPGHPVEEVRRYARRHRIEVVVMGEQALDAEEAFGDHLVRDPPCPVVLVTQGPRLLAHLRPGEDDGQMGDATRSRKE